MSTPYQATNIVRFEGLEVDLRAGELRRNGEKIKLQEQPLQILRMLLERPGEIVTREEIRQKLWPTDTFVEFDHSINAAIQRLRQALGDSAEHPRFVETMARRGYRFIAPVAAVYDRRPEDAGHRPALQLPALAAAVTAVIIAALALNVAGLRERLLTAVGVQRAAPIPKIESIAVLPLENLSGDPEQEYFADGMTDALITDLGNVGALRVISRRSVMQYKESKKALPEIARELNVDAIVEGTVQRSGERVRITVQLLHAKTDRHLWAKSYERDLRDVLTLQGELARAIADEVKAKVTPDVQARLASPRPVNPEALDLYLKGSDSLGGGDWKQALEYFQQAIDREPNFARAWLGTAEVHLYLGHSVRVASADAYARAKACTRKALELDGALADAHAALASALFFGDWDWLGAERELKRALAINPSSAYARSQYAFYLSSLGRSGEAILEARRALEFNPLSVGQYCWLAFAYYLGRRYDEALAQSRKAAEAEWRKPFLHLYIAWPYREKGMFEEAIAELEQYEEGAIKLGHLGNTYAQAGKKAEAQKAIQKLVELSKQKVGTYEVALVYAGLAEKDRAFEWLEKAYKVRDKGMCYLKVDPALDPLRSDPRFEDLLRRMNFPQ